MFYRSHTPGAPLCAFVESLWYFEGDPPAHTAERVLPNGAMQLIINLGQEGLCAVDGVTVRGPLVCGAYSESVIIDPTQLESVMGVAFHPGGAVPFFQTPSSEFHNQDAALDNFWGGRAGELRVRLLESPTVSAKFRILEACLLARLASAPAHHDVVAHAVRKFRQVPMAQSVADVAGETGYSQARFIRIFFDAVGLTPKVFCRIQRFQEVLRRSAGGGRMDWTRVALECGYFDQAHFNHDFRAFSGMNPTTYLAERGEFQNHVPVRD